MKSQHIFSIQKTATKPTEIWCGIQTVHVYVCIQRYRSIESVAPSVYSNTCRSTLVKVALSCHAICTRSHECWSILLLYWRSVAICWTVSASVYCTKFKMHDYYIAHLRLNRSVLLFQMLPLCAIIDSAYKATWKWKKEEKI